MDLPPTTQPRYQQYHTMEYDTVIGTLNVRNLSDQTHKALRIQAARHGRSMEAKVRAILDDAVNSDKKLGLGSMLAAIGRDFGGINLAATRDKTPAEPADFG